MSAAVRVRMRVPVTPEVTIELDRELSHFFAQIGALFVETDGFGNLIVRRGNTTLIKVPA